MNSPRKTKFSPSDAPRRRSRGPKLVLRTLLTAPSVAFEVRDLEGNVHKVQMDAAFGKGVSPKDIVYRDGSDYPWLVISNAQGRIIHRALHLATHDWMAEEGMVPARPDSWVVHHVNQRKDDARSCNLVAMSRGLHARLHREMARKHAWRRRSRDEAWFKPTSPALALSLQTPSSSMRVVKKVPNWQRGLSPDEVEAELHLGTHLDSLRSQAKALEDRSRKIPRPKKATDLRLPRLGCRPGECTAVIAVILASRHEHPDVEKHIATQLGVRLDLLRRILARTACQNALYNWASYRRLPKPCPPKM